MTSHVTSKRATLGLAIAWMISVAPSIHGQDPPTLTDDRLELTLFAEDPDIVTPIGMVIDERDRLFVIESHTHHPPSEYAGPETDRIKLFIDEDGDGKPERTAIFADGIRQAMNLAISPDGDLYVVCAREVLRLVDENRDGNCDRREKILELMTQERYAHNSLLGITFDRDGWLYVSRGNVGSHQYRFQGMDETSVEGYGDGGNVIRCRPDGTRLEEFATGFWNPFDLKFDRNGRLLLVDNDPDARGPNRLVHVVPGGDYGYKSLYGGGGNHPFQGWDGSLPGTLPFIEGTGEAPSGLLDCRRSSLPAAYGSSVLATIWNENSVERFDLSAEGGTLTAQKSVFLTGSQDFRPVAIDCDSMGNIFISDWVLVSYPNHGRGRIWRVSCRADSDRTEPQPYFQRYLPDPTSGKRTVVAKTNDPALLTRALQDDDPLVVHAAQLRLASPQFEALRETLSGHPEGRVRRGVLLASKRTEKTSQELIQRFLSDPDETVRRAALMWAGESLQLELRPHLELALTKAPVSTTLFETYLAAVRNLGAEFATAYQARAARRAKDLARPLDPEILVDVAKSDGFSIEIRGMAIRRFEDATVSENAAWLLGQLNSSGDLLAIAAIRRFAGMSNRQVAKLAESLTEVAMDQARSSEVRCEALLALSASRDDVSKRVLSLLEDPNDDVAVEAGRTFRAWFDADFAADCIETISRMRLSRAVQEQLSHGLQGRLFEKQGVLDRPKTKEEWHTALKTGGSPKRGRRVFFTSRVGCAKCHTVDGRGGILGPDLSAVAQSKSRRQIVDAILDPSAEFPPQFQAWIVVTTDGRIHRGLQLDHKSGGAIALITEAGENVYFKADEIEAYEASPSSLMPVGLSETMSVNEFQDLVAFLESMK